MYYAPMGRTGMAVSKLSYGSWATWGVKDDLHRQEGVDKAKKVLQACRDAGINLYDMAEAYGNPYGASEAIMGEAIAQLAKENPEQWRRSDLIITTKIFWGGNGYNEKGLSNKHISEGLDASLKRLQTPYVDMVFCHRPDPFTPTETVVRAMTQAVRSGKAKSWGTSEWSAQQITEAIWIARSQGLEPPQFEQPQYHMMHRERFEQEYAPLYREGYNMGTTIWSPLASGLLTGKYNDTIPEGTRLATKGYEWLQKRLQQWHKEGKIQKVRDLTKLANEELGCSVAQLAIAWCLRNPNVTTVLLGATKVSQIEENLGSIEVARRLTKAHMAKIEKILDNKPAAYGGYGGAGMRSFPQMPAMKDE